MESKKYVLRVISLTAKVFFIVCALLLVFSSFYMVSEKEEAVITTFGKVTGIYGPGLHLKVPIFQEKKVLPTKQVQTLTIGYDVGRDGDLLEKPSEAKVLTGDMIQIFS